MRIKPLALALFSSLSGMLFFYKIINQKSSVRAQNNEYWNISVEKYFNGDWVGGKFQCPDKTMHSVKVRINVNRSLVKGTRITKTPCVPSGIKAFSLFIDVAGITAQQHFQSVFFNPTHYKPVEKGQVATLEIVDKNTFNIKASNPPIKFTRISSIRDRKDEKIQPDEKPDYSMCSYYDEVAKTNNCKYHELASKICRDEYDLVNYVTSACKILPGEINNSKKNCIRNCLVFNDQLVRGMVDSCQINCNGETCTKQECIDSYHNSCFEACGLPKLCYGGNYPFPYANDDKKCQVKLRSGKCLLKTQKE